MADYGDDNMKQETKNLKASTVSHQSSTLYQAILCYCFKCKKLQKVKARRLQKQTKGN